MIGVLVVVLVLAVLLKRRAVKRRTLAGLNGERPVFSVSPPTRRIGSRKREAL
jgi:hypothetical protein